MCCRELVLCEDVLNKSQEQLAPVEEAVSWRVPRVCIDPVKSWKINQMVATV